MCNVEIENVCCGFCKKFQFAVIVNNSVIDMMNSTYFLLGSRVCNFGVGFHIIFGELVGGEYSSRSVPIMGS